MLLLRFLARRVLLTIPILFGITLLAFVIARAVPSDPVVANLGQRAMSDPKIVAAFRAEWGLDKPPHEQYLTYIGNLVQGNLGMSIKTRRPVIEDLKSFLPATIELAAFSILVGMVMGVSLGVLAAVFRNRWVDHVARFVSLIGVSLPIFWLALILLFVFYSRLGVVAGPGRLDPGMVPPPRVTGLMTVDALLAGDLATFGNAVSHLILPSVTLGFFTAGLITRVTRSAMLEVLGTDYVRTARAKGLREQLVVLRHAFRNAMVPVVTVIGFSFANLLAGTVLTERIFSWPGIGSYAFQASTTLDFQAIMGVSLLIAFIFIVTNLIVDVLYFVLDPRMRQT
jgi:peptide/nickel transport system permease protein